MPRSPHASAPEVPAQAVEATPTVVSGELVAHAPALPGFAKQDQALLDEAVGKLNQIYALKGLETAREIGEYVLKTFFDGDPANFRERGKAHVSFRELASHPDLQVSYSFISNSVAVVDQLRLLPEEIAAALPFTHQKLLLPVKDPAEKVRLAEDALQRKLTSRDLANEVKRVKEQQREGARVGRPPDPAIAKAFGKLKAVRDLAQSEPINADIFARYSPAKAKVLFNDVEHWLADLQKTLDEARQALDAWVKKTGEGA